MRQDLEPLLHETALPAAVHFHSGSGYIKDCLGLTDSAMFKLLAEIAVFWRNRQDVRLYHNRNLAALTRNSWAENLEEK